MVPDESDMTSAEVRTAVIKRDDSSCRVCGRYLEVPHVHHILFGGDRRGMGGKRLDVVEEMVVVDPRCHGLAHGRKLYWQPLLLEAARTPGVTALQLARWSLQQKR